MKEPSSSSMIMIDYNGYGNQQNTLLTNIHKNYKHTYKQYIYIYIFKASIYIKGNKKGKKSKKKRAKGNVNLKLQLMKIMSTELKKGRQEERIGQVKQVTKYDA